MKVFLLITLLSALILIRCQDRRNNDDESQSVEELRIEISYGGDVPYRIFWLPREELPEDLPADATADSLLRTELVLPVNLEARADTITPAFMGTYEDDDLRYAPPTVTTEESGETSMDDDASQNSIKDADPKEGERSSLGKRNVDQQLVPQTRRSTTYNPHPIPGVNISRVNVVHVPETFHTLRVFNFDKHNDVLDLSKFNFTRREDIPITRDKEGNEVITLGEQSIVFVGAGEGIVKFLRPDQIRLGSQSEDPYARVQTLETALFTLVLLFLSVLVMMMFYISHRRPRVQPRQPVAGSSADPKTETPIARGNVNEKDTSSAAGSNERSSVNEDRSGTAVAPHLDVGTIPDNSEDYELVAVSPASQSGPKEALKERRISLRDTEELIADMVNRGITVFDASKEVIGALVFGSEGALRELQRKKDVCVELLTAEPSLPILINVPQGAHYLLIDVSAFYDRHHVNAQGEAVLIRDSATLSLELLRAYEVAVMPGVAFGMDDHIKLHFTVSEDVLREVIAGLKKFLSSLK